MGLNQEIHGKKGYAIMKKDAEMRILEHHQYHNLTNFITFTEFRQVQRETLIPNAT